MNLAMDQADAMSAPLEQPAPLVGMLAAPMVSVVMSVYNEPERVGTAIESILSQSYRDFEFIVIDDGSTDRTPMVLEQYRLRDSRIRVLRQPNAGLTRALIRGCQEANGAYIARQDADDWSAPTRLGIQVDLLNSDPAIGFVSSAVQCVGPADEPLEVLRPTVNQDDATRMLLEERCGPPAHGSVMFRKSTYESVGGYRAEFYFGQDADLWLRMAERSGIAYSQEILYGYRRDLNAISARMSAFQSQFGLLGQSCRAARRDGRSDEPILKMAGELTNRVRSSKSNGLSSSGASAMAYLIGASLIRQGHPAARSYLWQSIRLNPLNWRAWVRLLTPARNQGASRPPRIETAD